MQQQTTTTATTTAEDCAILQCVVIGLNTRVATIHTPATIFGVDHVVVAIPATLAIPAARSTLSSPARVHCQVKNRFRIIRKKVRSLRSKRNRREVRPLYKSQKNPRVPLTEVQLVQLVPLLHYPSPRYLMKNCRINGCHFKIQSLCRLRFHLRCLHRTFLDAQIMLEI